MTMSISFKRFGQAVIALILLGSLTIQADPFKVWNWDEPTQYENNNPIPVSDTLVYELHCNNTPGEAGPPYDVIIALDDPGAPPSTEDMAAVVNGTPGTYYCAATATSTAINTTSGFSNEANFTVTPGDLGAVPKPPTNLILQ